tara:strand:+ start:50 stop:1048 length:999 start_codon:yes stop_codon:yes gene_type:complete
MKKLLLILVLPIFCISQEKYIKNDYVKMDSRIENDNYVIDYFFKDHQSIGHQIKIILHKRRTEDMIEKFGLPYSIFEPYDDTKVDIIKQRRGIIEDGLFLLDGKKIKKDKKALIEYYKTPTLQIANYIISYLQSQNNDTRENRIEMTMKFVQDIPYAIPKKNKKIYKNEYITPPEVLIEGYGDCDSKTILFVCIMSYLIPEDDIVFVSVPGHIFSAIKDHDSSNKIQSNKRLPQTQQKDDLKQGTYVELNNEIYFICETAGPGRPNYGQSDNEIKLSYIEKIDLSEVISIPGECYHSNRMKYIKAEQRLAFEHHSCYIFNPPTIYEMTSPKN